MTLFDQSWDKDMIIDLSRLEYINAAGIAILFSIFDYQKQNNNQIVIGGLHRYLQESWNIYFPSRIGVFESVDAAKMTLSGQSKCPAH